MFECYNNEKFYTFISDNVLPGSTRDEFEADAEWQK